MTQPDPLANATLAEMETFAAGLLPTNALDYYASGARDELTFNGNLAAWERWWFVPRMLIDVSTVSLATSILGEPIALPIMIAPMASQRMAHPGRRAGHGPGGRRGRDDHDRVDQHDGPDRGDRRGPRRQVLVPALPVHGLRGDRRDDRAGSRRRREGRLPDGRRGQLVRPEAATARRHHHARMGHVPDAPAAGRERAGARPGPTSIDSGRASPCPIVLKGILHPDDARHGASMPARPRSSSAITAAGRSTGRSRRPRSCPRWPRPSTAGSSSSSTAASGAAATSSGRSRSGRGRCSSVGPSCGVSRSTARPARTTCSRCCGTSWRRTPGSAASPTSRPCRASWSASARSGCG